LSSFLHDLIFIFSSLSTKLPLFSHTHIGYRKKNDITFVKFLQKENLIPILKKLVHILILCKTPNLSSHTTLQKLYKQCKEHENKPTMLNLTR
jgi:hypothetical protein